MASSSNVTYTSASGVSQTYRVTVYTTWEDDPGDPFAGMREPRKPRSPRDGGRIAVKKYGEVLERLADS